MSDPIDLDDPCARYHALRTAYHDLLTGGSVVRTRFRNGEDERETQWSQTNISALRSELVIARNECSQATTGRSGRFAIQGGPSRFLRGSKYDG